MRINIVSGPFYPYPPAPTGAVQRIWHDLAGVFLARGHTVRVQSCGYPGFPRQHTVEGADVRRLITLAHTPRTAINLAKDMAYSLRVLAALPTADVTVINCFWLGAILPRVPGHRRFGKTYVSIARSPKKQIKLYLKCDRLHAVSHAIATRIIAEQPNAAPITRAIPNPIDVHHFNAAAGLPPRAGPPKVLYTGRIHPEKGLDILVRATVLLRQRVPDVTLQFVGESAIEKGGGGPAFVDLLRARAGDLPFDIAPAIYDRARLAGLLRTAHAYCYPSVAEQGESFGVAPLEAMAVGVPVVVSALDVFNDFLRAGENGLVFDHRAADADRQLADQLHRVLTDPQLAAALGTEGARTGATFSNEAIADQFLADFDALVNPFEAGVR